MTTKKTLGYSIGVIVALLLPLRMAGAVDFCYAGTGGPFDWDTLTGSSACGNVGGGSEGYSPIHIKGSAVTDATHPNGDPNVRLYFEGAESCVYEAARAGPKHEFFVKGCGAGLQPQVEVFVDAIDQMGNLGGGFYRCTLDRVHFHTPSEHVVNDRRASAEMHMVFSRNCKCFGCGAGAGAGAINAIVVGAFYDVASVGELELTPVNPALEKLLTNVPSLEVGDLVNDIGIRVRTGIGATAALVNAPESFNPGVLLPFPNLNVNSIRTRNGYVYNGSLTTPTCTDNVGWVVIARPGQISSEAQRALATSMEAFDPSCVPFGQGARPTFLSTGPLMPANGLIQRSPISASR